MISQAHKAQYEADGYLVLRKVIDESDVQAALADAEKVRTHPELTHFNNLRARWQNHIDTGDSILDTLDPVIDIAPAVARIAQAPAILSTVETLLGEPVHLFKDKLIFKPPGAIGHAWHQDYIAWPGFPRSFTTVLVALDPANSHNGRLEVFAGEHRRGLLAPADGDYHDLSTSAFNPAARHALDLEPGDVAIFGAFLPHGSGANRSESARRHLYLSYNRASEGGDQRSAHYRQFHQWLRNRYAAYGATNFFFQ